jgi:hypothetical protein
MDRNTKLLMTKYLSVSEAILCTATERKGRGREGEEKEELGREERDERKTDKHKDRNRQIDNT